jgi:hypothetical protein
MCWPLKDIIMLPLDNIFKTIMHLLSLIYTYNISILQILLTLRNYIIIQLM